MLPWLCAFSIVASPIVAIPNDGFFPKEFLSLGDVPMGAGLALAMCLFHCCFPIGAVMALGACTWACHVHGQPWPWLLAHWRVIFPNEGFSKRRFFFFFFPLSMEVICASQHAFALVACPRGLLRLCCLPMDAALTLVTCFSNCGLAHGCWEHARGQCAHGDFLSLGYLPNGGLFYQMRGFSKRMFFSQRSLFGQASMPLPWP